MNPWVLFLITQSLEITLRRLAESGKFDSLTEEEAKQIIAQQTAALKTSLPTPEELIARGESTP